MHGRASTGTSHYFYRCEGVKTEKFQDLDGKVLVELRSTGGQTVLPPSIHPSGEAYTSFKQYQPRRIEHHASLRTSAVLTAVTALLARRWPAGSRHAAALAAAGFLVRLGVEEGLVVDVITTVARIAKDEEPGDRGRAARDTVQNHKAGGKTTGGPEMDKHFPGVVALLCKWFKVDAAQAAPRELRLVGADTIEMKPVRWLLQDRVPLGSFGLLAGREGIGKSLLAYTLVADITRGRIDGVFKGQPRSVIICATEDSWAHTIAPRLRGAGADLTMVFRVDVITKGINVELLLPSDVEGLTALIQERRDVAMVLLDPLIARLASKLDTHKDAEVRQALEPISRMADELGLVVLGIIHVNKGKSQDPLNSVMGSRAFAAVSRFVIFVALDPDDEDRRLMGQAKNNLGRSDLPTRSFTVEDRLVTTNAQGEEIRTGVLVWGADDDRSIKDVLAEAAREGKPRGDAAEWLESYLQAQVGPTASEDVRAAAQDVAAGWASVRFGACVENTAATSCCRSWLRSSRPRSANP